MKKSLRPPPLGSIKASAASRDSEYADILAGVIDEKTQRLVTVYSDNMMFFWDISDFDKVKVYKSFMAHKGPIHDIQMIASDVGFTQG